MHLPKLKLITPFQPRIDLGELIVAETMEGYTAHWIEKDWRMYPGQEVYVIRTVYFNGNGEAEDYGAEYGGEPDVAISDLNGKEEALEALESLRTGLWGIVI